MIQEGCLIIEIFNSFIITPWLISVLIVATNRPKTFVHPFFLLVVLGKADLFHQHICSLSIKEQPAHLCLSPFVEELCSQPVYYMNSCLRVFSKFLERHSQESKVLKQGTLGHYAHGTARHQQILSLFGTIWGLWVSNKGNTWMLRHFILLYI